MKKEISCLYGGLEPQKGILFVYDGWYVVEGSVNVSKTHEDLNEGVNIEIVEDVDCFTATEPINSLKELIAFIDE